jgi:hypothetical protein
VGGQPVNVGKPIDEESQQGDDDNESKQPAIDAHPAKV